MWTILVSYGTHSVVGAFCSLAYVISSFFPLYQNSVLSRVLRVLNYSRLTNFYSKSGVSKGPVLVYYTNYPIFIKFYEFN